MTSTYGKSRKIESDYCFVPRYRYMSSFAKSKTEDYCHSFEELTLFLSLNTRMFVFNDLRLELVVRLFFYTGGIVDSSG